MFVFGVYGLWFMVYGLIVVRTDHYRREGGLGELAGVVDRVAVQHDQLHRAGELEYPLDLGLHLQGASHHRRIRFILGLVYI